MVGAFADKSSSEQGCEIWMKANEAQTRSKDIVIKISSGVIHWVEDGSTYVYVPYENKVYYEDAITAGMAQWPGPILFETLANAQDCKIIRGRDPATGRERATLLCSLFSVLVLAGCCRFGSLFYNKFLFLCQYHNLFADASQG